MMILCKEVPTAAIPLTLLLEADPCEQSINRYLPQSWCFAALVDNTMVGVCVVGKPEANCSEIYNIAVMPNRQQQGIGKQLLSFVISKLRDKGVKQITLGTGTFGHQLIFYQRQGFRVESVVKDHFLDNYPEPIFESGIQHKDQLRLTLEL